MTAAEDEKYKALLLERQAELRAQSDMSKGAREAVELDQTSVGRVSRIDAIQNQAMALANERARTAELSRIKSALARIEDGEFGCCITCGEPIAKKRLALDPSVPTCITCASARG